MLLIQSIVNDFHGAARMSGASGIQEVEYVHRAAQVPEVPFDAPSQGHPPVPRRLHHHNLVALARGVERVPMTVLRRTYNNTSTIVLEWKRSVNYQPKGKVLFSQVSVCPQSASWLLVHCSALLWCGRYASYWNGFLFLKKFESFLWRHLSFSYFEFKIRLIRLSLSFQKKSCIQTHNLLILSQES